MTGWMTGPGAVAQAPAPAATWKVERFLGECSIHFGKSRAPLDDSVWRLGLSWDPKARQFSANLFDTFLEKAGEVPPLDGQRLTLQLMGAPSPRTAQLSYSKTGVQQIKAKWAAGDISQRAFDSLKDQRVALVLIGDRSMGAYAIAGAYEALAAC